MFRATSFFIIILAVLAITYLGFGSSNPGGSTSFDPSPERLQSAKASEQALLAAVVPQRDLFELAERLDGKDAAALRGAVRTTPLDRKVGDQDKFFVSRIEEKDYITVTATVRYVTDHAYWYVAAGTDYNLGNLKDSADIFEQKIYPNDHRYFGTEWSPGIDGDTHLTILLASVPGIGGYFSSSDEYPRAINQYSNEREMFYINDVYTPNGDHGPYDFFEGVLAHEFQHMIHWNMQRDRDVWLDEGMAELAMHLSNYDVGATDTVLLNDPDVQLTTWAEGDGALPHYGAAYLFVGYLYEHYGGADMLKALMGTPGTGVEAVNGALQRRGYSQTLDDVYKDWTIANIVNDSSVGDGRFAYDVIKGQPSLTRRIVRYPSTYNGDVSQYGADYITLERGSGDVQVNFQGAQEVSLLDTNAHSGTKFWYSNRRDTADTSLTREFDLSSVGAATLKFWTWYSIEGDYDYGFVEASGDGGKTWTTLKGKYTTDTDPQGANYGNGYSGPSGHDTKSTDTPIWVEESMDLTPYAGKKVQIRYEMVTDEALNFPNWAVDDISIPEINYSTDAETDDGGWTAAGFARVGQEVPQRWHVAAVEYGSGNKVQNIQEFDIADNGTGSLKIEGLGSSVSKVVLVVGGMATTTTTKSPYQIEVKRSQ